MIIKKYILDIYIYLILEKILFCDLEVYNNIQTKNH